MCDDRCPTPPLLNVQTFINIPGRLCETSSLYKPVEIIQLEEAVRNKIEKDPGTNTLIVQLSLGYLKCTLFDMWQDNRPL